MRSGEGYRQRAKQQATRSRAPAGMLLIALLAVPFDAAMAQMPGSRPEEPKPAKSTAAPSAPAKAKLPAPPTSATPAEDLPWLATTTAQPNATPAPQPPTSSPKTSAQTGDKKTASAAQKCEEQQEEGCRALKSCAWVAAMPAMDGKITPARCAERKVYAPEKEKKPKAAAAKPKPKPEKAAVPPVAATEPVKPKSTPKTQAKPEPELSAEPVTATIPTAPPSPAVAAVPPAAAPPVEPPSPAGPAAVPDKQSSTAGVAAPADVPASPAATPPTIRPRGAVPFLPAPSPKADAPADPPRSEAAPTDADSAPTVASGQEEEPSTTGGLPISIPGLVIAD